MDKRSYDTCMRYLITQHVRPTMHRQTILGLLKEVNQHFTIDEIYHHMLEKFDKFPFPTVYSTIKLLCSHGVIRELKIKGKKILYEGNDAEHAHLFCEKCGRVEDVQMQHESLVTTEVQEKGFAISSYNLVIHGTCEICQLARESTA